MSNRFSALYLFLLVGKRSQILLSDGTLTFLNERCHVTRTRYSITQILYMYQLAAKILFLLTAGAEEQIADQA